MRALEPLRAVRVSAYENHKIPLPTFIKTNEFTAVFQQIVDTYGTPTYEEANPAVISIASFPFFFGMMFGDIGHGSVLLIFSIVLIFSARKMKAMGGIMKKIAQVRYLFFIMGIMSCWAGLLYNEFFAIPMNLFGSCYKFNDPLTHSGEEPKKGHNHGVLY